jgi:hypothetical protein
MTNDMYGINFLLTPFQGLNPSLHNDIWRRHMLLLSPFQGVY